MAAPTAIGNQCRYHHAILGHDQDAIAQPINREGMSILLASHCYGSRGGGERNASATHRHLSIGDLSKVG